ncbi:hypothetical protein [Nonomuraea sp. GTA35]|uniref:hypothetical protein n=1 Tax=Nonomuraea sp. GTA35 TaxID=1676746 RepID=UPI0035BFCB42
MTATKAFRSGCESGSRILREAAIAKYSVLAVCVAAVALLVISFLWLAVTVLNVLVQGVATGLIVGGTWTLEGVADWHLAEVVTTPVHDYVTAYAASPAEGGRRRSGRPGC